MRSVNTFENVVIKLKKYWQDRGCLIVEPYNSEVGAGTFNPATFIRVLDNKTWHVCYVETTRRPRDGRYAENPHRVQQYFQFQVIMKPSPDNIQTLYLESLQDLGFKLNEHEIRFVEGDWEAPTLGAWGLGWEVWLDGLEITQFTYFQQVGGIDLGIIPVEITYGLERLAAFLQEKQSIFEVAWNKKVSWGDIFRQNEVEYSKYNFEVADPEALNRFFRQFEKEAGRSYDAGLILPGYDYTIKCSHVFNLLDARGAIGISERANMIARVRALANRAASLYLKQIGSPVPGNGTPR